MPKERLAITSGPDCRACTGCPLLGGQGCPKSGVINFTEILTSKGLKKGRFSLGGSIAAKSVYVDGYVPSQEKNCSVCGIKVGNCKCNPVALHPRGRI